MRVIALIFLISISSKILAQQSYTSIVSDNYVSSFLASYNPASIVDSKSKFVISSNFNNSSISNFCSSNYFLYGYKSKLIESKNPGYKNKYLTIDILNIKYELNHQNALAYSFRIRSFENLSGIPSVWANNTVLDYQKNIINKQQSISGLSISKMNFTEHNLTYARTIFDEGSSFLKMGASLKILNGINAKYFFANNGDVNFTDSSSNIMGVNNLDADFGSNFNNNQLFYKNRGLGLDIGFSYESRPNYEEQYYEMDGSKRNVRYDINKYKWKISGSITDIGWIRYIKDTAYYNFSTNYINSNAQKIIDVNGLLNFPFPYIKDSLEGVAIKSTNQLKKFRMNLPTALHGSFDLNVLKFFYVSYNVSIPLSLKNDKTKISNFFIHTVTPRIEKNKWSIMLPISQMGNGKFYIGCAGRVLYKQYSIFLGSNDLAFFYGQKTSLARNIYAGISYSILYKVPSDKDKDKISDGKDDCSYDPGLAEFNGCPDTDGDGIIDKEDECIYLKGPFATHGCPDTDGDGIVDMNDMCPDEKGLGIHYGCPDKDKDGVIDAADRCPDIPGIELNNGCPFENHGCCLDDDGDGVSNNLDRCPGVSGSVYNNGCPIDSTNIIKLKLQEEKEMKDANNTGQQVKDNPTIDLRKQLVTSKEEMDKILADKDIIKNLAVYFDVDQATLTDIEQKKLDNFVKSFPKKLKLTIVLIGYTDKDGSLDYNLILSKKRAETIQRKLIEYYGFTAVDIVVYYYGETKSIHKGSYTEEMKQADRKVEIKLVRVPKEEK
ncbi:MAG: OmpA family protein [Flavobacteriia bacterium]|nr:OmpA family protein [Flavobacteriia bacterium]